MKKVMVAVGLLLLAMPAFATFLYTPDGDRIRRGDSSSKVLVKLGAPLQRTYADVCEKSNREGNCIRWITVEKWFYVQGELYWTIRIRGGVVQDTEWTRR